MSWWWAVSLAVAAGATTLLSLAVRCLRREAAELSRAAAALRDAAGPGPVAGGAGPPAGPLVAIRSQRRHG